MEKSKTYRDTRFKAEVLSNAVDVFDSLLDEKRGKGAGKILSVTGEEEDWEYDTEEEFFAAYRQGFRYATIGLFTVTHNLTVRANTEDCQVKIKAPARDKIERIFGVFESHLAESRLPALPKRKPVRIFIGHGRSELWRELKDHLQDKHGYEIEAYEIGSRAGHTIRDILQQSSARARSHSL